MQDLIDGWSARMQRERAGSQMTLGGMIARLEGIDAAARVPLSRPHSYRGYYSDLAFELSDPRPVAELLAECRAAMGAVFEGYKGGDYAMSALTPVWVADYGRCGDRLIAIADSGEIRFEPEDDAAPSAEKGGTQ